jgi:hypothetical protein
MDSKIRELLALMDARHEAYIRAQLAGFTVGKDVTAWRTANRLYMEARLERLGIKGRKVA